VGQVGYLQRLYQDALSTEHKTNTYSECMPVALVIQHIKRKCRIVLPLVACLAHNIFPHCIITARLSEKFVKYKIYFFIFSKTFV